MSNNTPDYENNLAFEPVQTDLEDHIAKIGSQDELPTQGRKSDVLIQAIEKCEKLEKENAALERKLRKARTGLGYIANGWLKNATEMRDRAMLALEESE